MRVATANAWRGRERDRRPGGARGEPGEQPDADASIGVERAIRCRACGTRVTDISKGIDVGGHHEHTFFNPAGIAYRIRCFTNAEGCRGVGPASAEFAWFAGYRWQVAVCVYCGEHLGWIFHGDGPFIALIHERIEEDR